MNKGFQLTEETPDREYFTIIPNYIVNHSTVYEQAVYLVMKRIAGERGNCFASHQSLGSRIGLSRPTISKTIKKLLDRGWLREEGTIPGKTHPVKNYIIVDLWELNSKFYRTNKEIRQPQNISLRRDTSTTEPKIRKPQNTEEDIYIKKNIKKRESPSFNGITFKDKEEIASQYKVPLSLVEYSYESLRNYCESKGRVYRDYKAALRNFVLKDMKEVASKGRQNERYGYTKI